MVVFGARDGGIKELIPPPGSTAKPAIAVPFILFFCAMNCLIRTIRLHLQLHLLRFGFVVLFFLFVSFSLFVLVFSGCIFFLFFIKK